MWQFLCGKTHETDDARIVSWKEVFDLDSSVGVIKDCLVGIVQQEKVERMIGLLEGVRMYPYERFILRTEWNGKEWYLRYRRNVMGLFGKKKEKASEEKHQEMKEYIRGAGGSIVIKSN